MPLRLRLAVEDDSVRIGQITAAAFSDTVSRDVFPPHLSHKSETGDPFLDEVQWRAHRNVRRMREGKPTVVVVDIPDNGDGPEQVVGFAQWEPPTQGIQGSAEAEADQDKTPGCLDQDALREMLRVIDDETKRALGPDGHSKMWYLMMIAVDPKHHRRGIGKMLVQYGLDQAVKDGVDVYLIASPAGRLLYESLGFEQMREPVTLGATPHYSMIWKNPNKPATA
ncbi:hypothetical protein VTJ49DRAFT_5088 [Mycothermus thermophilus]|uniref:N-acetyltransferase domain-containing protein n=1 Tax=Humicola insolens TaxID=85995 RepID=A0ABR3V3W3_HUMIN